MARPASSPTARKTCRATKPTATSARVTSVQPAYAIRRTSPRSSSPTTTRLCSLPTDGEYGTCRVLCYSPRHDLGLGDLSQPAVEHIVEAWTEQYAKLGSDPQIGHVQIFENRGEAMGASNPHPHGQIWATEHVPTHVAREQAHLIERRRPLIADYLSNELDEAGPCGRGERARGRSRALAGPSGRSRRSWRHAALWHRSSSLTVRGARRARLGACACSSSATTGSSTHRFPTRWASTRHRPTAWPIPNGTCTFTSIRRSFAPRRCGSSWSATSSSPNHNAT